MGTTKIKNSLAVAVLLLFAINASAQDNGALPQGAKGYDQGFRLGFGLNGGSVIEDPYGAAIGGDVRLQYDLSQRTSLALTTGFTNIFMDGDIPDLGFIPVKAGFKGFIWEDTFYLLGEAGVAIPVTHDYDETSLILAPGIGFASRYVDISVRYEYYKDWMDDKGDKGVGQVSLRLAYAFKL